MEIIESHPEYHQVDMDVRRCLKRFPPGISYEQIGKLQKQLIAVILSVIAKHSDLKYYQVMITNFVFNITENVVVLLFFSSHRPFSLQGYHDVAVTFLIEVGPEKAYSIMEYLSLNHLREFLKPTMEETSYMLWHVFPLVSKLNPDLEEFITM